MKYKKIIALFLTVCCLGSFAACNSNPAETSGTQPTKATSETSVEVTELTDEAISSEFETAETADASDFDKFLYLIDVSSETELSKFAESVGLGVPAIGETVGAIKGRVVQANGMTNCSITVGSLPKVRLTHTSTLSGDLDPEYVQGRDIVEYIGMDGFTTEDDVSVIENTVISGYADSYIFPNYPIYSEGVLHIYDEARAQQAFDTLSRYIDTHFEGNQNDLDEPEHRMHRIIVGDNKKDCLAYVELKTAEGRDLPYYTLCYCVRAPKA